MDARAVIENWSDFEDSADSDFSESEGSENEDGEDSEDEKDATCGNRWEVTGKTTTSYKTTNK